MTDTISKSAFGNAELAAEVVEAYAEGDSSVPLTLEECDDLGLNVFQCDILGGEDGALGRGSEGTITEDERHALETANFSKEFIDALAGPDGKRALHERVKWFADNCTKKWIWFGADKHERIQMVIELAAIGPDAVDITPQLERARNDDELRGYITQGLLPAMGAAAEPLVPALMRDLESDNCNVRKRAAEDLGAIGPHAKAAIPLLTKLLNDSNYYVRMEAIDALGKIGAESATALPLLVEILVNTKEDSKEDSQTRIYAAQSIGEIGISTKQVLTELSRMLDDADAQIQSASAWALGNIGPDPEIAIPALIRFLHNPFGSDVAHEKAIFALGRGGVAAVPFLTRALNGSKPWSASSALAEIGQPAIPYLVNIFHYPTVHYGAFLDIKEGEMPDCNWAARTLGMMGAIAEEAIPDLADFLKNHAGKCADCEKIFLPALYDIGPRSIPALIGLLSDSRPELRSAVAFTLGRFRAEGRLAIPYLQNMRDYDENANCKKAASKALEYIEKEIP